MTSENKNVCVSCNHQNIETYGIFDFHESAKQLLEKHRRHLSMEFFESFCNEICEGTVEYEEELGKDKENPDSHLIEEITKYILGKICECRHCVDCLLSGLYIGNLICKKCYKNLDPLLAVIKHEEVVEELDYGDGAHISFHTEFSVCTEKVFSFKPVKI